ncbi:MAG: KID repeat protein [Candidatus Moranbacteria bacterium GW2011_GWC2_37_8]|nr:MAG: KID repeat protein [Candidatus Moranbacteria bacterium GW2011_GWC2_37_8]KKQ62792.1 MAG: coiled-coil [Parcubacteria group bacterium GW2011_GWC1_38_22]KKQ81284.1 MAG: KID repeat protein [Candidatus Moranbacteria bacterium GW2011_GWD2_38_7]
MKNETKTFEEKAFTATEVGSMIERFDDKLNLVLETMDIKFENVNERFDRVENRLDVVETKIDRLQDDIIEVKFELKRKVPQDDFEKLEKRVVKLEKLSLSH